MKLWILLGFLGSIFIGKYNENTSYALASFRILVLPYWLANNALRGTLKQYGVDLSIIPAMLTQEISEKTIEVQSFYIKRPSVFKQLYELQLITDHNAITIKNLINGELKYEYQMTPEIVYIRDILIKYGLVDP